ncbi:G1/S-specific cyclin-D2 [Hyalella azteca]|uniref:G1/S-specific cyclin-D2 n=1 Tax=Hyalella azteca TaxID=294128 RepID=A0A8B7NTC9_HYAAZ|nr:G1/S-specific cyclin-D2 [Hyalella azteca]
MATRIDNDRTRSLDCPRSELDLAILDHDKTIANLIELESKNTPLVPRHKLEPACRKLVVTVPRHKLEPACRKLVVTWMLEVCEEQHCEDQVFVVAVSLLDKFLSVVSIRKTQLQLLAAVCLLLSSKLRQSHFLSVDLLAYYTDNSITRDEITQWEVLVVAKLGWDLGHVTALDFVDSLLRRLAVTGDNIVRRHALTFVALAATESDFVGTKPSLIATAAIVSAVRGIYPHLGKPAMEILSQCLRTDMNEVKYVLDTLERTVDRTSKEGSSCGDLSYSSEASDDSHSSSLSSSYNNKLSVNLPPNKQMSRTAHVDPNYICYSPLQDDSLNGSVEDSQSGSSDYEGYETPTDITDVHFAE